MSETPPTGSVQPTVEDRLTEVERAFKDLRENGHERFQRIYGELGEEAPSLTDLRRRLETNEGDLGTARTNLDSLTGRVNEMDGWIRRVAFPFFQPQPRRNTAANDQPAPRVASQQGGQVMGNRFLTAVGAAVVAVVVIVGGLRLVHMVWNMDSQQQTVAVLPPATNPPPTPGPTGGQTTLPPTVKGAVNQIAGNSKPLGAGICRMRDGRPGHEGVYQGQIGCFAD